MLTSISIKNLAVIENTNIDFKKGMTTVTGETGAGKSVLIKALNLILGERVDKDLLRKGKDRAEIIAEFDINNNIQAKNLLKEKELLSANECIVRRLIIKNANSKAFINNVLVPLILIRELTELLIDIHGQNEHQSLLKQTQQRDLLDNYANSVNLVSNLNSLKRKHKIIQNKIENISNSKSLKQQQKEILEYQLKEFTDAKLVKEELETIEDKHKKITNFQTLANDISSIINQLESENGAYNQLTALSSKLINTAKFDKELKNVSELLTTTQIQVKESIYELNNYLNSLSFDEEQAQSINLRLEEFYELARKHKVDITSLLQKQNELTQELININLTNENYEELKIELDSIENKYYQESNKLTKIRNDYAVKFQKKITKLVQILGMTNSEFKVKLSKKEKGIHLNGNEDIKFLIKTNTGDNFKALNKVASGGELSRVSLAIFVVASKDKKNITNSSTLVFDEVDVGISGNIANIVGEKLKELSEINQIICITHLAQVAALGTQQFKVEKITRKDSTVSNVEQLSKENRVNEIAKMLAGSKASDHTIETAKELLADNL